MQTAYSRYPWLVAVFLGVLSGCTVPAEHLTLTLDESHQFHAVIERPQSPNGAGVLLIGGGYSNDINWTTHGVLQVDGREVRSTINGRSHADAPVLSQALTDAGFIVMRYSTIRLGDPQHAADPATAEPLPFLDGLELARQSLAAFRQTPGVDRVYLAGHSLGATRAALIADEDITGFVFLAGAYLSRTTESPAALARAAATQPSPDAIDLDGDGKLAGWEHAAAKLEPSSSETFLHALPWPIDRLKEMKKPILAVFGGLDPISLHGPSLAALPNTEVRYIPALGHQLGPEAPGEFWPLSGPIDTDAVKLCARWLTDTDDRRRTRAVQK